jgi:Cu-processing system permease protein
VNRSLAIAINTFKETIRDRVLNVIVIFALAMIVAGLWLASISLDQQARMMKDFGLAAVTLFGLVVAVFAAGNLVRKEIEKRTVFVIFSKTVGRAEFIFGKFLGLALTVFIVVLGMGLFLFLVTWLVAGDAAGSVLVATLLIYAQVIAVMAVTIFFSTFASALLSSVLGVCVFVAGQLSHNVLSLTRLGESGVFRALSWLVFIAIPNLAAVDIKPAVVGEGSTDWGETALWLGYLVAYVVAALLAATFVFRRKEF